MKDKIIQFDAEKREVQKAWDDFKRIVNSAEPQDIRSCLLYMEGKSSTVTAFCGVFNPDWQLTGRIRAFMQELELEFYINDFESVDEELPPQLN